MLLTLMLLAVPDPETAVDAERAFNRAAQTEGQWTAFRKFSTDDAVIFTPQPAKAHEVLPRKDPRLTIQWWPAESYVSCDGSVAVNTGPWVSARGVGYFTTVWVRQADGHFKWVYDGGDTLTTPRALPEKPKVTRASCDPFRAFDSTVNAIDPQVQTGDGVSADGTLSWDWVVGGDGHRVFEVRMWNGEHQELVLRDRVAPAK